MNDTKYYDLVILGWGASAFSAAIKASEMTGKEMRIAMVGKGPIGGTCVNMGCVPSKYLLEASHNIIRLEKPRIKGLYPSEVRFDDKEIMTGLREYVNHARREKYENVIRGYKNVELFKGTGRFSEKNTVSILGEDGKVRERISAPNVLIATGSSPIIPDIKGLDEVGYLTSDTIWNIDRIPSSIAIIGGGAVGLEIGQALSGMGSEVTIIEARNSLLPQTEPEIGVILKNRLEQEGIRFLMNSTVKEVKRDGGMKVIKIESQDNTTEIHVDELLVAVGRKPNTDLLNLEIPGVMTDKRGGIIASNKMETNIPGIYAAGDVVSKEMYLETLAAREGVIAVNNMFGEETTIDYSSTPWAVFTYPQVASVGMTEVKCLSKNGKSDSRTLRLKDLTKATIMGDDDGIIKVVVDPESKRIAGMHVIAPNAAEIIMEGVYAVKHGFTIDEIIETTHIFPTISEGIKLAAQSFIRDISSMSCCME